MVAGPSANIEIQKATFAAENPEQNIAALPSCALDEPMHAHALLAWSEEASRAHHPPPAVGSRQPAQHGNLPH